MTKLLATLAILAALSVPTHAQAFDLDDCDDAGSITMRVRQMMPRAAMPTMPRMPKAVAMPRMPKAAALPRVAQPAAPAPAPARVAAAPEVKAPKVVLPKLAKLGGPKELCKKYLSSIGSMVELPCGD